MNDNSLYDSLPPTVQAKLRFGGKKFRLFRSTDFLIEATNNTPSLTSSALSSLRSNNTNSNNSSTTNTLASIRNNQNATTTTTSTLRNSTTTSGSDYLRSSGITPTNSVSALPRQPVTSNNTNGEKLFQ